MSEKGRDERPFSFWKGRMGNIIYSLIGGGIVGIIGGVLIAWGRQGGQFREILRQLSVDHALLDEHLRSTLPHPACNYEAAHYRELCDQLESMRTELRSDIQALNKRIDEILSKYLVR